MSTLTGSRCLDKALYIGLLAAEAWIESEWKITPARKLPAPAVPAPVDSGPHVGLLRRFWRWLW